MMSTSKKATDTDRKIGALIRKHRVANGWTQMTLAAVVGITYQQLQKYERGVNRVGASRLYHIALALKVPVASFFPEPHQPSRGLNVSAVGENNTIR